MSKFSFIMPVKNRESLIIDSIDSILAQTIEDWELVIVEDGSSDRTPEIITGYQKRDKRIRCFFNEKSHGPGFARDIGIRSSSGEIIVIADSDDISEPDRLDELKKAYRDNSSVAVIYSLIKRNMNGKIETLPSCEFSREFLNFFNFIPNPSASFKKSAYLSSGGYDSKLITGEDYDLWLTFLEKGFRFKLLHHPLVTYGMSGDNITLRSKVEKRRADLCYIRDKHNLKTPSVGMARKACPSIKYWRFISTPFVRNIWFN